ncbi:hypothetical protein KR018_008468, partial [Drosophila ironensis]
SNPPEVDKDVAEKVRFHFSKEELDRQTRSIHENVDTKSRPSGSGRSTTSLTDLPRQDSWSFENVGGFYIPTEDLSKMSLQRQEQLLMRDLIYAFSGVPTSHIKPDIQIEEIAKMSALDIAKVRFLLDDSFSSAFRALANDLLPLIGYYISVQSFIEETNMTPSCGKTRLALATAFGNTMQQYYDLQSKLETDLNDKKLNLKDLIRQTRPWLATMKLFAGMASTARSDVNSAQLLTLLDKCRKELKTNDAELKERIILVISEVTRSYMKIVQLWMQKGVLYDNQHEFFVQDNERSKVMSSTLLSPEQCCHAYWAQRYKIFPERLPDFLLAQGEQIFLAGKYLNILRQCNISMTLMQEPLSYNADDTKHLVTIERSYKLAASKLLEVVMGEHNLVQHLRNLRGYFLLQTEGFAEALMEKCHEQLQCTVERLIPEKVQGLLYDVLKKFKDPFKAMLCCQLKACDAATQLAGLQQPKEVEPEDSTVALNLYGYESFAMLYTTKWPLSFILNSERLEELQVLQRIVFMLRYVQRQLTRLWKTPTEGVSPVMTPQADSLRLRMHLCMQNLEHHITLDIAESRWQALILVVEKAHTIDEVLKKFCSTLDECLQLGLLSADTTFVGSLFTLSQVCLNFCGMVESTKSVGSQDEFDKAVLEFEAEFGNFLCSILGLVKELAKNNASSGKEAERDSCKQLLKRLEEFTD